MQGSDRWVLLLRKAIAVCAQALNLFRLLSVYIVSVLFF